MVIIKSIWKIRQNILYARTPPKRTAISLAIGIALAFGPMPGLHLICAFFLTKTFRLNGIVLAGAVFVHNPWTMIPIHAFGLALGDLILYGHLASIEKFRAFPWEDLGFFSLFQRDFWLTHGEALLGFLPPFIVGSTVVSLIGSIFSYKAALRYLSRSLSDECKIPTQPTSPNPNS